MRKTKKENLANPEVCRKFLTYREASEWYGIGLTRLQEYARRAGATYKLGNKVLVNTSIFEMFLEQYRIPGECEELARSYVMNSK